MSQAKQTRTNAFFFFIVDYLKCVGGRRSSRRHGCQVVCTGCQVVCTNDGDIIAVLVE